MEEEKFENEDATQGIDSKLQETIDKKVAELKSNNPKAKVIPLMVDGDPDDDKEYYIGYFCQPSFVNFSKYLTLSQKDQVSAMRQLARDCFLDGDRELIDNDSLFLFGLMGQLQHIIKVRGGRIINLSKPGK